LDSITSSPEGVAPSTLLFRVGGILYGCDINASQEIIPLRATTRLPGAPAYVRGLINVRGVIVTVLDLGVRLDASRAPAAEGSILLVRHRERLVGVAVDEVVDVRGLEIDRSRAGESGEGGAGGIVAGVATVGEETVIVLDLEVLVRQVLLS
jgi:purine-binding chemotaxis protein CheW